MRHSQALGKRARLERAAASSIKKQRVRERMKRLQELQEKHYPWATKHNAEDLD